MQSARCCLSARRASVFQLYGAAIVVGFILMVLSLGDGPHGLKVLYRDVKRHVVGP